MNEAKTLAQAATDFLASLSSQQREDYRQELNKFVRWCGKERSMGHLAALEVSNYAEGIDSSSSSAEIKAASVKAFLSYCKKQGLTESNFGIHIKVKKASSKQATRTVRQRPDSVALTAEGYQQLKDELAALKEERPQIAETIRKAAADKDFKENAPLDAAKEHQGMVEARIRQLETTLKTAVVASEKADSSRAARGTTVVLRDLSSDEELRYTLVNPSEASPSKGKLSIASPTGKALLDREQGETVAVSAPAGTLHYRIEHIES